MVPGGYLDQDWERIERMVRVRTLEDTRGLWRALFVRPPWYLRIGRPFLFLAYRSSAVHTIVDVTAYLGNAGERLWYEPSTPARLTDTRLVGACPPGQACTPGKLPANTKQFVPTDGGEARIVNLTVVDSQAPGWLQVGRCADVGPEGRFSNLNVADAGAHANMALVPAGDSGTCAFGTSTG